MTTENTAKPAKDATDAEWKKMRDASNEATMASSEALQDDALTDGKVTLEQGQKAE